MSRRFVCVLLVLVSVLGVSRPAAAHPGAFVVTGEGGGLVRFPCGTTTSGSWWISGTGVGAHTPYAGSVLATGSGTWSGGCPHVTGSGTVTITGAGTFNVTVVVVNGVGVMTGAGNGHVLTWQFIANGIGFDRFLHDSAIEIA